MSTRYVYTPHASGLFTSTMSIAAGLFQANIEIVASELIFQQAMSLARHSDTRSVRRDPQASRTDSNARNTDGYKLAAADSAYTANRTATDKKKTC